MKQSIVALLLVACSHSSQPAETPVEKPAAQAAPASSADLSEERPECVDEEGNKVECEFDKDCCEGFSCGIDPEGSYVVKVCMWNG